MHTYIYIYMYMYIVDTRLYIYRVGTYTYTPRARADAGIRVYALPPQRDSLCMSLLLVFSFVFLLFSYVPFAVSCVTVPGDLDLIFSRLSCAVRFDLTRGYWQQNRRPSRRASSLRNPIRAALTKLPDAGRKERGRKKRGGGGREGKKREKEQEEEKKERLVT